jgi:hypothetical protein
MATTVWLRRSTTSFCYELYGVEKCRWIPSSTQYEANSVDVNSLPLSVVAPEACSRSHSLLPLECS